MNLFSFSTETVMLIDQALIYGDFCSACDCFCDCYCDCQPSYPATNKQVNPIQYYFLNQITMAYIELTTFCNNSCSGCGNIFSNNRINNNSSLPISIREWNTIFNKLSPDVTHLNVTGGEPTLYEHFKDVIRLMDEHGFSFTLFTNARWLDPQSITKTLKEAKGLKGLLISLHGKDDETHESFTGFKGSYNETIRNIRFALSSGISVHLCTIITRQNYTQLREIYELSKELGVQKLVFNRYVGLPDDDCAPNKDQLRQALTDIEAMRISGDAVKLSVTVPQCFHPTSAAGCGAGRTYITIDPRGNVRPCNHSPLILGNLCRESLETILQSKQLESWHNLIPSECRKCSAFDFCGGGCKADTILNQSSKDSLMCRPFHPKEGNQFIVVSENLRPVLNPSFHQDSLPIDMDCQTRHILMNSLDGNITLKELGVLHGQKMLNLIGTMHHAGVIEFR